ncbi:MAG: hypothetical protein PVH88_09160 [Ignavibacteria bacterium]|jgi:hypothetical protein
MKLSKKIYLLEDDKRYLEINYRNIKVKIYDNQKYIIEYILDHITNKNNNSNQIYSFLYDFNDLYNLCNRNNFYIYAFAYQNKNFIKLEMFEKWKRLGIIFQNKRNII